MKRKFVGGLWAAMVPIVVLAVAGCSSAEPVAGATQSAEQGAAPVAGGTLTVYTGSITKINPPNQRDYVRPIVDGLVYQDPTTLEYSPWLATSWEINEDASEYVFHLRDDVTFSDGSELDAETVKKNFDFFRDVVNPAGGSYARNVFDNYVGTEVVDDLTVKVTFNEGNVPFLTRLGTAALGILSSASFDYSLDEQAQGKYWGSGPYTVESFQPGVGLVYQVREDYAWGPGNGGTEHTGRGYVDTIEFKFVDETSVREGAVQSGEVDIATGVSTNGAAALAKNPGIQLASRPQPGTQNGAQWNFNRPIPQDYNVRRALQLAIDREALSTAVTGPQQAAGTSPLEPSNLGYQDQTDGQLIHDPDEARRLLEASGWTVGADGIREKDGTRLTLVVTSFPTSKTLLELVKDQAKEVGIELDLQPSDNWGPDWRAGSFDLLVVYQTDPDPDILRSLFWSESPNTLRQGAPAENAELDELLVAQLSEPDVEQRAELVAEAQRIIVEDAIYLVFNQGANVAAAGAHVGGTENFTTFSDLDLYNIWLSE